MAKNNKSAASGKVMAGVGITAVAAAAAAGAYFLYGTKDAKKNRKQVYGWALKAKGEVLEKMEALKEVNEDAYNQIVDAVGKRYGTLKNVDPAELMMMTKELKGHWKNIQKEFEAGRSKVKKITTTIKKAKAAAKPAKKTTHKK